MEQANSKDNYTGGVDFKFLKAMGIDVVKYQPWQLGLFKEELDGKFIWYPRKGTLMFSYVYLTDTFQSKIGESGDFIAGGIIDRHTPHATEKVYEEIVKKVTQQNL